jgi:chitinase
MIWSIDFDVGSGSGLPGDPDDEPAGNSPSSDLVWVSPEIWDKPNPQVYCAFPCTVVLPPYTKVTTTSQYPIVTVTSSGYTTTITWPPMTISVW